MKKLIALLTICAGFSAQAGSIDLPTKYELLTVNASCKKYACSLNEETGEETCRYKIYFDDASYEAIQALKSEGLRKTWFEKAPSQICQAEELPSHESGETAPIKVLVYGSDVSVLNDLF